jgi:hypothetical protein
VALDIGDHQNLIRTRIRRFLRDTCGISQRIAQNLGDSAEYAVDAAAAYFLGGLSKVGKAADFASQVIKSAAQKTVGKVTERTIQQGGRYGDLRRTSVPGHQSHHPISDSISPILTNEAPAFRMQTSDHMRTASWGSRCEAKAYRDRQKELINSGRIRDAMALDIRDVRSKFGKEYNREIQEMLDYAKKNNYLPRLPGD